MRPLFIVADDHPLFRGALKEILLSLPQGAEIVDAAREALTLEPFGAGGLGF